jgi:putative Holliday junction resolvase
MTTPTRLIAIDLGDKRTGLALADTITRIASPAGLLDIPIAERDGDKLLDAIAHAIDDLVGRAPADLIVGLPINMDGSEGPRAKLVRAYAQRIAERTDRAIHFQDERQSSMHANDRMAQTGLTHKQKKARRDAIAAVVILQRYLDDNP